MAECVYTLTYSKLDQFLMIFYWASTLPKSEVIINVFLTTGDTLTHTGVALF